MDNSDYQEAKSSGINYQVLQPKKMVPRQSDISYSSQLSPSQNAPLPQNVYQPSKNLNLAMKSKPVEASKQNNPVRKLSKLSKMSKSSQCLGGFIKACDYFKAESGEKLDKNKASKNKGLYKFDKPIVFARSSDNGGEQYMMDSDSSDGDKFEEEKIEKKFEKRQSRRITK